MLSFGCSKKGAYSTARRLPMAEAEIQT
jgi:hypothetical protein